MLKTALIVYIIAISLLSVILTVYDKLAAIHKRRRISENMLMFLAIIGGGIAMFITMLFIRHKTRHPLFMIGIPLVLILELLVIVRFYRYII